MENKHISKSSFKSGHKEIIGETIAKLKLFYEGYNVYSRFLDIDAVDFIVRHRKGRIITYKEIQMKYSKYYPKNKDYWHGINKSTFEARDNFFFMFICGDDDHIFFIPSKKISNWLKKLPNTEKRWHIHIKGLDNIWYLAAKRGISPINITKYLNQFNLLK